MLTFNETTKNSGYYEFNLKNEGKQLMDALTDILPQKRLGQVMT